MKTFWDKVLSGEPGIPADAASADATAHTLNPAVGADVYPESLAAGDGALWALARRRVEKFLLVVWPASHRPALLKTFAGARHRAGLPVGEVEWLEAPCSAENAAALRRVFPHAAPQAVAGRPSIGLGDRLGLATPGHVRAVRGTGYVPMLAQQSIREMTRTRRSPREVLDDATWGVFQTGYRDGFGADADHLKTADDIDRCAAAGFLFFTIDPGDHVDNAADAASAADLAEKFAALPWTALEISPDDTRRRYAGRRVDLGAQPPLVFDEETLRRAAVKYGRAVAHTAALYRHLAGRLGAGRFELEVSVDETDTPTTPAEHCYVASELARLGVAWVSLAPRFVGRFEKGVDYLGDLAELERTFTAHLAIAGRLGGYKLSLHSGSDKFSVYAMAARHGGRRVHVKTAGTSYLEALRVLAACEAALFREIYAFALQRYDTDKATYHVSARLDRMPRPESLRDADLPGVLEQFDARQALHVTFGSVLTADEEGRFRGRLLDALRTHEEAYAEGLRKHLGRHLAPFLAGA